MLAGHLDQASARHARRPRSLRALWPTPRRMQTTSACRCPHRRNRICRCLVRVCITGRVEDTCMHAMPVQCVHMPADMHIACIRTDRQTAQPFRPSSFPARKRAALHMQTQTFTAGAGAAANAHSCSSRRPSCVAHCAQRALHGLISQEQKNDERASARQLMTHILLILLERNKSGRTQRVLPLAQHQASSGGQRSG